MNEGDLISPTKLDKFAKDPKINSMHYPKWLVRYYLYQTWRRLQAEKDIRRWKKHLHQG